MSKHLVPVNVVHTARAGFTAEDKEALDRYSSFGGFKVNIVKISQIFNEFTDAVEFEVFTVPEKLGTDDFWPDGETYLENENKRKAYFFPHCFIPKLFFSLQPVAARRAGIFHIFKLLFDTENEHQAP